MSVNNSVISDRVADAWERGCRLGRKVAPDVISASATSVLAIISSVANTTNTAICATLIGAGTLFCQSAISRVHLIGGRNTAIGATANAVCVAVSAMLMCNWMSNSPVQSLIGVSISLALARRFDEVIGINLFLPSVASGVAVNFLKDPSILLKLQTIGLLAAAAFAGYGLGKTKVFRHLVGYSFGGMDVCGEYILSKLCRKRAPAPILP